MPNNNPSSNNNNDNELTLDVYVRSRTKNYFQGSARSLTATNKTGQFDILPMHANFITMVKDWVIVDKGLSTEKKIEFTSAVISVNGNHLDVYVGV